MRGYLLISLLLVCFSATAGIYKWVDENGKVHYSDTEVEGAEQVELPKPVTYTPTTRDSSSADADKNAEQKEKDKEVPGYTEMKITQPAMNETIRNNSGTVEVIIQLTPGLMPEHTITVYLDGKELLKGKTETTFTLQGISRGSHTLRASVFDKNGVSLISASSVIFHLKKAAVESESNVPEDNSNAYTPNFKKDESEEADFSNDYSKDYSDDFSKDYDSSDSYKEGAESYKKGIPSKSGSFSSGSSYKPNYNQK
jgi:hypothetical protein